MEAAQGVAAEAAVAVETLAELASGPGADTSAAALEEKARGLEREAAGLGAQPERADTAATLEQEQQRLEGAQATAAAAAASTLATDGGDQDADEEEATAVGPQPIHVESDVPKAPPLPGAALPGPPPSPGSLSPM